MDLQKLLLFAAIGAFCLLLVMEVIRPYRNFGAEIAKASFATNTKAFLFNNVILSVFSASSLYVIAERYGQAGLLSGVESRAVEWFLSFVLFDFSVYLWHASGHKFEVLWRFHKIHHSDKSINVTTGFLFHVFDLFLELIYKCIVVVILGLEAQIVLVCEILRLFFVLFHHSNISFRGEKWLSQIIITPALHRVHHSALRSEHDSNYGIVLSIWDRMFDTRKELIPERIGLDLIEADNFVQLFFLAFITERHVVRLLRMIPRGKR